MQNFMRRLSLKMQNKKGALPLFLNVVFCKFFKSFGKMFELC